MKLTTYLLHLGFISVCGIYNPIKIHYNTNSFNQYFVYYFQYTKYRLMLIPVVDSYMEHKYLWFSKLT